MTRKQGAIYEVAVPAAEVKEGVFRYNIVAFNKGKRQTFPGGMEGTPLDWDYIGDQYWETRVVNPSAEISLVAPSVSSQWNGVEQYTVPQEGGACFLRKYIRDEVAGRETLRKREYSGYLCRPCSKRPPHCFLMLIPFFWINSLSLLRIFRSKCRRLNRWRFLISPRIWCSKKHG